MIRNAERTGFPRERASVVECNSLGSFLNKEILKLRRKGFIRLAEQNRIVPFTRKQLPKGIRNAGGTCFRFRRKRDFEFRMSIPLGNYYKGSERGRKKSPNPNGNQ